MSKDEKHLRHTEVEVRFLEIDKDKLIKRLKKLEARDQGEDFLTETIFYDKEKKWLDEQKFVRIRSDRNGNTLTYKHQHSYTATGTKEIEFSVPNVDDVKSFLEELGVVEFRVQEKKRHTLILDNVTIDIDEWPSIPVYVELEGEDERDLRRVAEKLDLDWGEVVFENAKIVLETKYDFPVSKLRYFTFNKVK